LAIIMIFSLPPALAKTLGSSRSFFKAAPGAMAAFAIAAVADRCDQALASTSAAKHVAQTAASANPRSFILSLSSQLARYPSKRILTKAASWKQS
jgi:hypothetical protein